MIKFVFNDIPVTRYVSLIRAEKCFIGLAASEHKIYLRGLLLGKDPDWEWSEKKDPIQIIPDLQEYNTA